MTMVQTTTESSPSDNLHCSNCKAELPPQATFCASCGARVVKKNTLALSQSNIDIAARYRLTSLIRRRPYVNLFFAIDNQQQRPVAIREINIKGLLDDAQTDAWEIIQQEYDLLRREHIASIMSVIDLRQSHGHLYVVAGWPSHSNEQTPHTRFYTLQQVLQSGIGLPDPQVALTWIEKLCIALEHLHRHEIVIGDLDTQALVLRNNDYSGQLALMVSWLPSAIRDMLPRTSAMSNTTSFSAPEVLLGKTEPRSDIYSLGAVLYYLLTGIPPEEPTTRMQRRLRSPAELNSRVSSALDDFVMEALAIEPSERFHSAKEMAEAVFLVRSGVRSFSSSSGRSSAKKPSSPPQATVVEVQPTQDASDDRDTTHTQTSGTHPHDHNRDEIASIETILITPLPETSLKAWQEQETQIVQEAVPVPPQPTTQPPPVPIVEGKLQATQPAAASTLEYEELREPPPLPDTTEHKDESAKNTLAQSFKKHITGILPAIPRQQSPKVSSNKPLPKPTNPTAVPEAPADAKDRSFFKQLQHLILGEQKHATTAAAIIETPLRIQPNQAYTIRIQLMGRDKRNYPDPVEARKGARIGGLSALVEGEVVYIEVRSALFQSYAYIVQQAAVYIPAQGYAAEVTIPMQPLSSGPSGRRDRLHIFFMDEMRRPLYEKPFVVELFISHLVQPGREGHNVLTIPL